jgi:hypothetical protein
MDATLIARGLPELEAERLHQALSLHRLTHGRLLIRMNTLDIEGLNTGYVCIFRIALPHHDFGDMVRTAVSPAAEDEADLDRVEMRMPIFEALVEGYLDSAKDFLTEHEVGLLAFSAKLITLEVGMRFVTDHLEGDRYFKVHRPNHNLDRCRTQFALVEKIDARMAEMEDFVSKVWRGC